METKLGEAPIPWNAEQRGTTHPGYVLGVLVIVYTFNYMDRYLLASLVEPVSKELGVSDSYMGFLLGPAFALAYSVAAIPIARLADRRSRVLIIAAGCFIWSLFTVLSGFADDSKTFATMRIGVGLGEAAFFAPAYSLVSDYFPPHRRGLAIAILTSGIFLGQVIGLNAGPFIADGYGWRQAFIIIGMPGLVLALVCALTVRDPVRQHLQLGQAVQPALWRTFRIAWARPSYRLLTVGSILGAFAGFAFAMWGPTLLVRVHGMSLKEAGVAFGLGYGLSSFCGILACGRFGDWLIRYGTAAPMRLAAASLFALALCMWLVCITTSRSSALVFLVAAGLLGGGYSAPVLASLQNLLPGEIRATATAIWSSIMLFCGLVWGPYLVGLLSDIFSASGTTDGLRYALIATSSFNVLGALLLLLCSRTFERDAVALDAAVRGPSIEEAGAIFRPRGH